MQKAGKALDRLPVYCRANTDWQINTHTHTVAHAHTHTPICSCGKFRISNPPDCVSVGCGKKPGETRMQRLENEQNAAAAVDQKPRTLAAEGVKVSHSVIDSWRLNHLFTWPPLSSRSTVSIWALLYNSYACFLMLVTYLGCVIAEFREARRRLWPFIFA